MFRESIGDSTALPTNTVVRLKERWGKEYQAWRHHLLSNHRYAYVWADGIYLGAGIDKEKTALLCVLGAREDRERGLLAMEPGYRESTESCKGVLQDLRDRALEAAPLLGVGDGALGLWAALDKVYPTLEHQRCWNDRITNVQASLPKRLWAQARRRLRQMTEAETLEACEELRNRYVAELLATDQRSVAENVLRDREKFVTFYRFPKEHWIHLRTTNPLEFIFSGVRLRSNAAKRVRCWDNALYLVFKIMERLSRHWRPLNGGLNLMALVLEGENFKDGMRQRRETHEFVSTVA